MSEVHWPASLAYLVSFWPVREPASNNKVDDSRGVTPEVLLCTLC